MSEKKVLIVDDSAADLLNLKKIVEQKCPHVLTAQSGAESVQIAVKEKPDLIFMDIVMDDVDGYSACRQILENPQTKHIPVVFVSHKNQKADVLWAEKQGGRALIPKPYSDQQIIDQMNIHM